MDSARPHMPSITIVPASLGGGYHVAFVGLSGRGETLDAAFADLHIAMRQRYASEKGDETAEADTARRQADILANDRFIRGHQFQGTVMLAAALGLV